MKAKTPTSELRSDRKFYILSMTAVSLAISITCYFQNIPALPDGPATSIAEVTKSLASQGTMSPTYFQQIYADATALSKDRSADVWQDVFSLGKDGDLLPKHSPISAVLAVPFYIVFGNLGFWILQEIFFLLLVVSTYLITEAIAGRGLPWSNFLATCLFSQTLYYSYGFSYDLHGCTLIIGGLNIIRTSPCIGGAIMTLSLFARPSNLLLVIPIAIISGLSGYCPRFVKQLLGVAFIGLLYLLTNYLLWGSLFQVSYSRLPAFLNGQMYLSPHPTGLDLETFLNDWPEKLFGPKGLLPYNMSLIALPFVISFINKSKQRQFLVFCLLVALGYTFYIFSYPMWTSTANGNRFLLPAIYLYLLPFILFLGQFETHFRPSLISTSYHPSTRNGS